MGGALQRNRWAWAPYGGSLAPGGQKSGRTGRSCV